MKHLVMGTAGHVDHGKTALVKALTGFDCDTHREEKERGITIHLGFTHLGLKDGSRIGIIDVPGHRDFVHTMLSGASGVDFALLVVAADSGVMPQTVEHLRILEILGIEQGLIALTKADLVDESLLEVCRADVAGLVAGTFLQAAPMIAVSAVTGQGIEELKAAIRRLAERVKGRPASGGFRMYIDRAFSSAGFGTVVAGTVASGKLSAEGRAFLLPGGPGELRVRRMERHGEEVKEVRAGDRASLNLVGLERSDIRRGMLVADRPLNATAIADAELTLYAEGVELGLWSQVMFHTGAYESQARLHLIDRDLLRKGETAVVQVHLSEPCVLVYGDRFVVRNSSSDTTLGGGRVIDPAPLHHRRRPEKLVREVGRIAKGDLGELIAAEIAKAHGPVSAEQLGSALNLAPEAVLAELGGKPPREALRVSNGKGEFFIARDRYRELETGILGACALWRQKNPLAERGANLGEIRGALKLERTLAVDEVISYILDRLVSAGRLVESSRSWLPTGGAAANSQASEQKAARIEAYLESCGMTTPLMNDVRALSEREGMSDNELKQVLRYLTTSGRVVRIEESYLHRSVVDRCRAELVALLKSKGSGVTVAEFRDRVGGNRKICLLLLALFDAEGLTRRKGELRFAGPAVK